MLALLGAMSQEVDGLRRSMAVEETLAGRGWRLFKGRWGKKPLLLARTGPGKGQVERAAAFILDHYPVGGFVSFGFAGALTKALKAGDLVLCRRLYMADSMELDQSYAGGGDGFGISYSRGATQIRHEAISFSSSEDLLSAALRLPPVATGKTLVGSSVTAGRLVTHPNEKEALGRAFGAEVVDMESYWVARMASEAHISFLALRAVSDGIGRKLPPFDRFFDAEGRWLPLKAAIYFLSHPTDMARMPSIYVDARRAGRSLACFVSALVSSI